MIFNPGTMTPVGKTQEQDKADRKELSECDKVIADNLQKTVRT